MWRSKWNNHLIIKIIFLWSNQHLCSEKPSLRRELSNSPGSSPTSTLAGWPPAGGEPMVHAFAIKGIDNRMRRRFRGNKKMPKIGYGSDRTTRYYLPNGLKKFIVKNVKDLDVLLMNNRTYCAEIAHNVSTRVYFCWCRKELKLLRGLSRSESRWPILGARSELRRRNLRLDVDLLCSFIFLFYVSTYFRVKGFSYQNQHIQNFAIYIKQTF